MSLPLFWTQGDRNFDDSVATKLNHALQSLDFLLNFFCSGVSSKWIRWKGNWYGKKDR
jgi:hypothetical protein